MVEKGDFNEKNKSICNYAIVIIINWMWQGRFY